MKKELGDKCEISEHSLRKSVKQLYDSIYKWLDHGCLRGVDNFIDDIQNIADYFEFMSSVVDVKALWLKSLQQKINFDYACSCGFVNIFNFGKCRVDTCNFVIKIAVSKMYVGSMLSLISQLIVISLDLIAIKIVAIFLYLCSNKIVDF